MVNGIDIFKKHFSDFKDQFGSLLSRAGIRPDSAAMENQNFIGLLLQQIRHIPK